MKKIHKAIQDPSKVPPYIMNKIKSEIRQARVSTRMWYYRMTSETYTEAYRKLMSYRIKTQGPRRAVGSDGVGIGRLQFNFLKERGLEPTDSLLDIGCGSLRGGQYFIQYLNKSNYTGMDISQEAIESGEKMIDDNLITEKQPKFYINSDLKFNEINEKFGYVIAQSVFTHLPAPQIRECLKHLDSVLAPDGEFYATFFTNKSHSNAKNFVYSMGEIENLASEAGWEFRMYPESAFPHPRNQKMARFTII